MSEERKSSDAAQQPTSNKATAGPTVHEARLGTEPVVQTDLDKAPDVVLVESLGVSAEMQKTLRKAIKRPNLVTISYIDKKGTVQNWWQVRQFPDDLIVRTLELLRDDTGQKLLGRPPLAQGLRDQFQARRGPTKH